MKLVQLLAKELKEWPESAKYITQEDDDGSVTLWYRAKPKYKSGEWVLDRDLDDSRDYAYLLHGIDTASDNKTSIVTQDQWQAEREKMNKPKWIRHRGGWMPVGAATIVEVRLRCGDIQKHEACEFLWRHKDCDSAANIMAYRIIEETKDQEIEEVETIDTAKTPTIEYAFGDKDSDPKDLDWKQLGTLTYNLEIDATEATQRIDSLVAKWGQIESPLKWRDAIIHCQAIIEDCEREIERNVNLLDAEGLMMQKDSKKAMQHYAPDVDFSDWRNWQIGDRVCATKNFDDVDIGDELIITRLDHADEEQPIGMSAGSSSTSWPKMIWVKFVCRP